MTLPGVVIFLGEGTELPQDAASGGYATHLEGFVGMQFRAAVATAYVDDIEEGVKDFVNSVGLIVDDMAALVSSGYLDVRAFRPAGEPGLDEEHEGYDTEVFIWDWSLEL